MTIRHAVIGDIHTNCYLLTDEESGESAAVDCAVFDADYQALLRKAGVTSLKYILLTHGHFDHISGVKQLKDACGGLVCIHHEDAECLTNPKKSLNSYVKYAALETVPPDVFVEEAKQCGLPMIPYVAGFFLSVPCEDSKAVCDILHKDHIYLVPLAAGVRIALCSIPLQKIPGIATKLNEALKAVEEAKK